MFCFKSAYQHFLKSEVDESRVTFLNGATIALFQEGGVMAEYCHSEITIVRFSDLGGFSDRIFVQPE